MPPKRLRKAPQKPPPALNSLPPELLRLVHAKLPARNSLRLGASSKRLYETKLPFNTLLTLIPRLSPPPKSNMIAVNERLNVLLRLARWFVAREHTFATMHRTQTYRTLQRQAMQFLKSKNKQVKLTTIAPEDIKFEFMDFIHRTHEDIDAISNSNSNRNNNDIDIAWPMFSVTLSVTHHLPDFDPSWPHSVTLSLIKGPQFRLSYGNVYLLGGPWDIETRVPHLTYPLGGNVGAKLPLHIPAEENINSKQKLLECIKAALLLKEVAKMRRSSFGGVEIGERLGLDLVPPGLRPALKRLLKIHDIPWNDSRN